MRDKKNLYNNGEVFDNMDKKQFLELPFAL